MVETIDGSQSILPNKKYLMHSSTSFSSLKAENDLSNSLAILGSNVKSTIPPTSFNLSSRISVFDSNSSSNSFIRRGTSNNLIGPKSRSSIYDMSVHNFSSNSFLVFHHRDLSVMVNDSLLN